MKFEELTAQQLSQRLVELLKKQPPTSTAATTSTFGSAPSQQPPQSPMLQYITTTSEILQLIAVALQNPTYNESLKQQFSQLQIENSFLFTTLKQIQTQTTVEKQNIEVLTSKCLLFLTQLLIQIEFPVTAFQDNLVAFLNQSTNLTQQSTMFFVQIIAITSVQSVNKKLIKFLISIPILEFSNSASKTDIMNQVQNQKIIVHFDKIKNEFFKRFLALKDANSSQKQKITSNVLCPFGEYERESDKDESAKKMKLQPQVYGQMVDGINNIIMTIRQEVCGQFEEKAIQVNYSVYNVDWIENSELDVELQIFYLVQVLNVLKMIKNDYYINSYQDSIIDESPYEILYAKQYEVNEGFIRKITDNILQLLVQVDHSSEKLNKCYENIVYSIVDSNNFDKNTNTVKRNGVQINIEQQLLEIIKVIQTIQDMKLFLITTINSIDFTSQVSQTQTVLQLILQQSLNTIEFNDAFGIDILQLFQVALSHNVEQTRQFMANNRTLKIQNIETYVQNQFNFHNQYQGKLYEKMNYLLKQIQTNNKELSLVDLVLSQSTPAQVFKGLTDVLTKVLYDFPMNNVTFTFDNVFDSILLAYLSNPKYFITRCLIQLNTFFQQVSNATIEEIIFTNNLHLYNYANSQKLEQIVIQSHTIWLEILCSPVIDFTIIEQFISIENRFKQVAIQNFQQQLFNYKQVFNKFQMLMVNNKITATALLHIFTDIDNLFTQNQMQQFHLNFQKIFNYDLENAFLIFKTLNVTSAKYYCQLFNYLQLLIAKAGNVEILFNILKNSKQPSIQHLISMQIANTFNLIQKQEVDLELPRNLLKFLITIITNYKMNPFSQSDSSIIYDIFQSIFDNNLEFANEIFTHIQDDNTMYLLSFFLLVLLEQYIEVNFNDTVVENCYNLLILIFNNASTKSYKDALIYDLEQKSVLILHKIKQNIKNRKYQSSGQNQFNQVIFVISGLINKKVNLLALLSQLFEIKMLCFYHYDETIDLSFADDYVLEGQQYQSNIILLVNSLSNSIANSFLNNSYVFSNDLLLQIIFLLNIINFCCNVDTVSHSLYYAVLNNFDGKLVGWNAPDQYTKLLISRISQLRDKVSLNAVEVDFEVDFFFFLQQLQQAVSTIKIIDTDVISLQQLYDQAIRSHIQFQKSQKLFTCNTDLLAISSLLINKIYQQADQSIFCNTLQGMLCEKILVFIYLNFYGTKQNQIKININIARGIVQIDNQIIEKFTCNDDLMRRVGQQIKAIHE